MIGLPLVLACVGCTTTYRTAQGTEFHETDLANLSADSPMQEARRTLLANGAADLACPEKGLTIRSVLPNRANIFLVEGCGWRATYARDCQSEPPAGHDGPGSSAIVCRLELIGKVQLARPTPAPSPPPPAEPAAILPKS